MPLRDVVPTAGATGVVHHLEEVMGTIVTLDVYPGSGEAGVDVAARLVRARQILQRADDVFSTWKSASPLSRLRRGDISLSQAPPEVADVLDQCAAARDMTDGWFDPWAMPGGVDPTGFVKGWAAQRALEALRSSEFAGAMVNAAGDIASFGGPAPGAPFRVGIVDPFARRQLACVVEIHGAIATSGTYERGQHLIDPHHGQPSARVASASVCGPDLGLADALATAVAVAGQEGLALVEKIAGYEALTIAFDGPWRWTPNFPFA
jgi:thiamine biosynthesis lipoprotein